MVDFFKIFGGAILGALITFTVMTLTGKKDVQPIVQSPESFVKTVYVEAECEEIVVDSIAVYEEIRRGKLQRTKPNRIKEKVVEEAPDSSETIKMATYVYEDSTLYVGENILYKGEILDFQRSIQQDTLVLSRMYHKETVKTKIEYQPQEVPVYVHKPKFRILAGGAVQVQPNFGIGLAAGFKTKKDQIFLFKYGFPRSSDDPALYEVIGVVPLSFQSRE